MGPAIVRINSNLFPVSQEARDGSYNGASGQPDRTTPHSDVGRWTTEPPGPQQIQPRGGSAATRGTGASSNTSGRTVVPTTASMGTSRSTTGPAQPTHLSDQRSSPTARVNVIDHTHDVTQPIPQGADR